MGLMLHTEVKEISDKAILDAAVEPVTEVKPSGSLASGSGRAAWYAVAHHGSNNMITLRYRLKGVEVRAAEQAVEAGGLKFPAGSFPVPSGHACRATAREA